MTMNRTIRPFVPAFHASIWAVLVGVPVAVAGVWLAGCANQSRVMELEPLRVDREWRRSVGAPQLALPTPRIASVEGGVSITFRPSATIDRSTITRSFMVNPTATIQGSAVGSAGPVDLEALAAEAIASEYPALASNAEAAIAPARVRVGQRVLATGSGRSLADLELSIDPEPARIEDPAPVELAAKSVSVTAARLVARDEPSVTLVVGRRIEVTSEQRFDFPIDELAEGDCRRLRTLLLGGYEIVAECEIRTGATVVVSETRTFGPSGDREWQDPIRRTAKQRLEAIAASDPNQSLAIELLLDQPAARRGEVLPAVLVTNVSARPVLELRPFSAAFQVRSGATLSYVGSGVADGEPCLCPGETLEIVGSDRLDPCGDSIDAAGEGLLAVVSTSGLDRRTIGPIPVESTPRFGAGLLPPRTGPDDVLLEASTGSAAPAGALEIRLVFDGDDAMRVAFPQIPAGGSAILRLPADLDEESAATWARWTALGGRVEAELLEASQWNCEGATPAKQAFRIGR
jgi:hypothetical protein